MNNSKNDKPTNENKHIPRYIKSQPWFYKTGDSDDYLVHHRQDKAKKNTLDIDHNDEAKVGSGINDTILTTKRKYNDIAHYQTCENCGGTDHRRKDCIERPKKSHRNIISDKEEDVNVRDVTKLDWDAKQDRWFGYTGEEYDKVLKGWEEKQNNGLVQVDDDEMNDTDEEIELIKLELLESSKDKARTGSKTSGGKTSVRLREDKAAYLKDINSGTTNYDPKSRLYKAESLGSVDEKSNMFRRHLTGEGLELDELNKFSREEARNSGIRDEIENRDKLKHVLIANPTKYEKMMKQQKESKYNANKSIKQTDISKLSARKITGTKQNRKTKDHIADMY